MNKISKNTSGDDIEDEVDAPINIVYKQSLSRVIPVKQHPYYLYGPIGAPGNYVEMINTIRTAEAHDDITIYLNSDGGRLDTGIAICSAIAESRATVTTVLDSSASSMAAIIFLAGHQYVVHDCTMLMFHTFSGGFYGKSSDVDRQIVAYKRQYSNLVKKICSKFLTTEEIKKIDNGEELWLMSDLIEKRLKDLAKQSAQGNSSDSKIKKIPKPPKTQPSQEISETQ
jgi:ATP-dependent protease ClpP protease subunit